jgi:hypothetical protein
MLPGDSVSMASHDEKSSADVSRGTLGLQDQLADVPPGTFLWKV